MKQSRLASLLESWGNTVIGFAGSVAIQYGVCWWWGLQLRLFDNLSIIGAFTVWSLLRNYGWRRAMEHWFPRRRLSAAMQAVIAERYRQIDQEGYDAEHDSAHAPEELARAAACYLLATNEHAPPVHWMWDLYFWKPRDMRRNFVRGTALGMAALDRLEAGRKRKVAA